MAAAAVETFGGIDILIDNAAIHLDHAQLPYSTEALPRWRAVMNVNVIGAVACRAALASGGGGSVINQS
jgi:NAD(P)-dependent dehydrogenase (short-subunit alcohol dehydrogenase family)